MSRHHALVRIALLVSFAFFSGCGMPLTDGAERLADDIKAGANKLRSSNESRIEIQHKPLSVPEGVQGRCEIGMRSSLDHPRFSGSLFINEWNSRQGWGTNYHLNYVRVPRALSGTKDDGESVFIVLNGPPMERLT